MHDNLFVRQKEDMPEFLPSMFWGCPPSETFKASCMQVKLLSYPGKAV